MSDQKQEGQVLILGGGISGLATAWNLHKAGIPFKLIEKQPETGGAITSKTVEGSVMDFGPNSLRDRTGHIRTMAAELGLSEDLIQISEAFKTRYIVRERTLQALSPNIASLISTKILSSKGKLRLLKEPFIQKGSDADESIGDFLERRIGKEAVDYLVDPIFSGIYAGDIYRMDKKSVLPKLAEFEQDFGSIAWGAIRAKKEKRTTKPMVLSFRKGIQQLTNAITDRISDHVVYDEVVALEKAELSYRVRTEGDTFTSNRIISCIPAYSLAGILRGFDPELSSELAGIDYAPMLSTQVLFKKAELGSDLNGFGFLIPRKEKIRLLGAIWKSSIFPELTADGYFHATLMTGGAHDRGILTEPVEEIEKEILKEFAELMGTDASPAIVKSHRWKKAIPQFDVGYEQKKQKFQQLETQNPGFCLGGNYRWGVSVPDCIQGAEELVQQNYEL